MIIGRSMKTYRYLMLYHFFSLFFLLTYLYNTMLKNIQLNVSVQLKSIYYLTVFILQVFRYCVILVPVGVLLKLETQHF